MVFQCKIRPAEMGFQCKVRQVNDASLSDESDLSRGFRRGIQDVDVTPSDAIQYPYCIFVIFYVFITFLSFLSIPSFSFKKVVINGGTDGARGGHTLIKRYKGPD